MIACEWIVELQEGCWIAESGGRTVVKGNAERFFSLAAAAPGLMRLYEKNRWPEVRIHADDEMYAKCPSDLRAEVASLREELARAQGTHPWGRFLEARAACIEMFTAEGFADAQIADQLSMDAMQVGLIRSSRAALQADTTKGRATT